MQEKDDIQLNRPPPTREGGEGRYVIVWCLITYPYLPVALVDVDGDADDDQNDDCYDV